MYCSVADPLGSMPFEVEADAAVAFAGSFERGGEPGDVAAKGAGGVRVPTIWVGPSLGPGSSSYDPDRSGIVGGRAGRGMSVTGRAGGIGVTAGP